MAFVTHSPEHFGKDRMLAETVSKEIAAVHCHLMAPARLQRQIRKCWNLGSRGNFTIGRHRRSGSPLYLYRHRPQASHSLPSPIRRATLTSPSSSGLPGARLPPGTRHRSARRLLCGAPQLSGARAPFSAGGCTAPAPQRGRRRRRAAALRARPGSRRARPATEQSFVFPVPRKARPGPPPPVPLVTGGRCP